MHSVSIPELPLATGHLCTLRRKTSELCRHLDAEDATTHQQPITSNQQPTGQRIPHSSNFLQIGAVLYWRYGNC